jgi:hypothetical protein
LRALLRSAGAINLSWDLFALDFPRSAKTVAEIPPDFKPSPIGKRAAIIEQIQEVAPGADFSDPSWGRIAGEHWSIEVNLGKNEDCDSFTLHVRGGDAAIGVVEAILQRLNLRAIDSQTGEFFAASPEALESFRRWREFRDQVVGNERGKSDS